MLMPNLAPTLYYSSNSLNVSLNTSEESFCWAIAFIGSVFGSNNLMMSSSFLCSWIFFPLFNCSLLISLILLRRPTVCRCPMSSDRDGLVTCLWFSLMLPRQSAFWDGRQKEDLRICAWIPGTGRRITPMVSGIRTDCLKI